MERADEVGLRLGAYRSDDQDPRLLGATRFVLFGPLIPTSSGGGRDVTPRWLKCEFYVGGRGPLRARWFARRRSVRLFTINVEF